MRRFPIYHLLLLPLWIAAFFWTVRMMAAERHFMVSESTRNEPVVHVGELEEALRLNPWNGLALASMGRVMTAREDWTGAIEYSQQALEAVFYPDLVRQLANAYAQRGLRARDAQSLTTSYKLLHDLLLISPRDTDSIYRFANLNLMLNRTAQAESLARMGLEMDPYASDLWYLLNSAQTREERYRESMHSVHRFLLLGPSGNIGQEVFDVYDYAAHLSKWDAYIHRVEAGEVAPSESEIIRPHRGQAVRSGNAPQE